MRLTLASALIFAASLSATASAAQSVPRPDASTQSAVASTEIWAGVARNSPSLGVLGKSPGMSLAILAIRVSRPLDPTDRFPALRTTVRHFDIIPIARLSPPYISRHGSGAPCPSHTVCVNVPDENGRLLGSGAASGVGVNPLGFTTSINPERSVVPSFGATGGLLFFNRRVPSTRGAKLNFTAAVEAGVRFGPPNGSALVVSYRFHHISNAGFAPENLAVASHLLTFALRSGRGS